MSDGDTNDQNENPFDGFSFSPDWAKGSADAHGEDLRRRAARFEDRGDRGDRRGPRGDRPFRGDRPPLDQTGYFQIFIDPHMFCPRSSSFLRKL